MTPGSNNPGSNNPGSINPGSVIPDDDLDLLDRLLRTPNGLSAGPAAQRLRMLGCVIEAVGVADVRLTRTPPSVWRDYLEYALRVAGCPRPVRVYQRIGSTQDAVRDGGDPMLVVLAEEQTAGRGRLGRTWVAPPGSAVLMSMGHTLDATLDRVQYVTAVATAQALERLSGRRLIQIKWPNDLVVEGGKLAGILVETTTIGGRRVAVIGVGVNVELTTVQRAAMPADFRDRVACLRDLGCAHDRLLVAAEVSAGIDRMLRRPESQSVLEEWRRRNLMRSQRATFRVNGQVITGEVVDLDADAGLIVRTDTGQMVHLHAATTTVVGSPTL